MNEAEAIQENMNRLITGITDQYLTIAQAITIKVIEEARRAPNLEFLIQRLEASVDVRKLESRSTDHTG